MGKIGLTRASVAAMVCAFLLACGQRAPVMDPGMASSLEALKSAVSAQTGYPAAAIDILAGPAHMRISLSDQQLAQADQATREHVASAVVAAVEPLMASDPRLTTMQEISVAIVHPADAAGGGHTEDVISFRKGPNQRYTPHVT